MTSKSKKSVESPAPADTPSVLTTTMKRFDDSWDYQTDHWHEKWERDGKLYDGERYKRNYIGLTDTVVPMVQPTIETMVSALSTASLRFEYESNNPVTKTSAAPLNGLVSEWWDEYDWDIAIEEGDREMLAKGMAGFMWSWDIDHPHLDWFSMRDAILDPTVKRPRQLQEAGAYAGRRYFVRKGTMADFEVVDTDPESETYGELKKRYNLPPAAETSSATTKDDDKAEQEKIYSGSTLKDASEQQDEIIEIWDIDRVVTIMNRKHVIEDVENPYKARHRSLLKQRYLQDNGVEAAQEDPFMMEELNKRADKHAESYCKGVVPFFFFRNYRKISLFYADSEINAIWKEVERLNDMTDMEGDSIIKQLARQRELDPVYKDWLDMINSDPDTTYPFKPGSLQYIQEPPIAANSFQNRLDIKNVIRETTGIDQVAKGGQSAPGTTATEVIKQEQSTNQRIESKARILEKDGLYWMAWILFKLIQLYQTEKVVVSVSGMNSDLTPDAQTLPNGQPLPAGAAIFDPAAYQDDWKPSINLEIDAQAKRAKDRADRRADYQILIQDPTNNLQEVKKRYYPKMFEMDKQDMDAITTPSETVDPLASAGAGVPGVDPADQGVPQAPVEAPQPGGVA